MDCLKAVIVFTSTLKINVSLHLCIARRAQLQLHPSSYQGRPLSSPPAATRALELAEQHLYILAHSALMCVTALTDTNWLPFVLQAQYIG